MAWSFNAVGSGDNHGAVVESSMENHVLRRYYWGLQGQTEIRSAPSIRTLSLQVHLGTGQALTHVELLNELALLDFEVGEHGDLTVIRPDATTIYENCTLDSVEREMPVALPDIADTIHPDVAGTQYHQMLRLNFTQLLNVTNSS